MPRSVESTRLYEVQQIDLELERLGSELQTVQMAIASDSAVRDAQARLNQALEMLHAAEQQLQAADAALEETSRRLKTQEQRLYGNQTSVPTRDLHALQQEVGHLREQQSAQEERVLLCMDALDQAQAALVRERAAYDALLQDWEHEHARLQARLAEIQQRTAELQAQRQKILAACEPASVQRYETLRRTKQGKAVAKVIAGTCQWCRVTLTSSEMQRLRQGNSLQVCGNCGRILYLEIHG